MVERDVANVKVAGSNPVSRSIFLIDKLSKYSAEQMLEINKTINNLRIFMNTYCQFIDKSQINLSTNKSENTMVGDRLGDRFKG